MLPGGAARQQQSGEVGAGDQHDQADDARKHEKCFAVKPLLPLRASVAVGDHEFRGLDQIAGRAEEDNIGRGLKLGDRYGRLEPGHDFEPRVVRCRQGVAARELRLGGKRDVEVH